LENRLPLPGALPAITGKLAGAILAAALVVSGVAVYRYRQASTSAAGSYTTAQVQRGTITDAITGTGPIAASQAVPLNFKNSGKVAEIDVTVGDKVKAGQVLAKLDDSDLKAQLSQATANLANAQANLNKLRQGPTPTDVAAAQAAVDAAARALASAQDVAAKDLATAQQSVADATKNLESVQAQIDASTAADKVAVDNAQKALAEAQKVAQALPAVLAQQIEQAKSKLYADQLNYDAQVARGQVSKEARQAALDVDQAAIDQANASAQQQLAQARQNVTQAQNTLNSAQATLQNDLAKFQGQLVSAQTQLNTAKSNLASTQSKSNQSISSAQSSLQTAQATYNQKVATPTQAEIDAATAQVEAQKAAVQLAQNNLDAAVLTAPTDGTVTAINGAVGQWLTGGATSGAAATSASGASASSSSSSNASNFISLTSLSGLQVTAQINESDIGRVQIGQPVNFTVDAFPNRTFTGKVAIIQPLGQNVSNVVSYTVTSTIDQTDAQLLPGMTATVNIIINQVRDALEVPMSALTYARTQLAAGARPQAQASAGAAAAGRGQAASSAEPGAAEGEQAGAPTASAKPAGQAGGAQARAGAQGQGQGGQARGILFEQPGGPGVLYLLKDGKPNQVRVQFGPSDGRFVQVVSGVSEGDVVITGGGPTAPASSAQAKGGFGPGGGAFFVKPGG
jgi:HlyD family secretion protein